MRRRAAGRRERRSRDLGAERVPSRTDPRLIAAKRESRSHNVYIAKLRASVLVADRRPQTTRRAAEELGMRRPHFAMLANWLHLEAREKPGKRGGKPAKFYASRDLALAKTFLDRCAKEGGRAVLGRLLGSGL